MSISWYKHKKLEEIADGVHAEFAAEIPIDIDYIAEKRKIEILDIGRLKEDYATFGLLGKVKNKFIIFVQKGDLKLNNYHTNFTIAEELSHFILHREYFKNVKDINEAFDFYARLETKSQMIMEQNAKYLAGAILLPREHLKKKAMEVYKQNAPLFNEILENGNEENCEAIINGIASFMCDIYHVPEGRIAARLRTSTIGLKDFLRSKYKEKCN